MNLLRRVFIVGFVFIAATLVVGVTAKGLESETPNLITNPSVETGPASTSGLPDGWQTNSWGTNSPNFSYVQNEGAEGRRSMRVETTAYTNGDAKWYFNHIAVKPSTSCTFSNSYKSNVATNITIQYQMNDGSYQYAWLDSPASSASTYKRFAKSFTTPANVKSMTVFHILNKVGWLNTDSYSLTCNTPDTPPAPQPQPGTELIPNNSVENGSTQPDGWVSNAWGNTAAKFSYVTNGGADGRKSVQVDVTSGTTGDSKWYFNEVAVQPNKTCTFSDSYRSNVATDVTVGYTLNNGTKQYAWLGGASASSTYARFTKSFTTPANVKSMTVYHVISKAGWLNTDAFSLKCEGGSTPPPVDTTKFKRPLVSIEFDDGWKNAYDSGFPIVEEYGFRATQYVIAQTTKWNGYMNDAEIRNLAARGHDIGSHTVSHPHLPQLTDAQINSELQNSKNYLQNVLGKPVNLFVTPYCESDSRVRAAATKLYSMLRNCEAAANTKKNFDAYNLRSYIVYRDTTNAQIQSWINDAKANNSWMILVYHEVQSTPNNDWAISPNALRSQMKLVKDSGVTVLKTGDALAEVKSQL